MTITSPKTKTAILVLGMHRSGTSATTGVLSRLGLSCGDNLMPPHPTNPNGFYEAMRLYELNTKILRHYGSEWDDVFFLSRDIDRSQLMMWLDELVDTLKIQFGEEHFIAIKDPRICLLFPLYEKALEQLGYQVKIIIPLRSPREVVRSLARRENFSPGRVFLIWAMHLLSAELYSRGHPRTFFLYSELLVNTAECVVSWQKNLGIKFPVAYVDAEQSVREFLDAPDKHGASQESERYVVPGLVEKIAALVIENDLNQHSYLTQIDELRLEFLDHYHLFLNADLRHTIDEHRQFADQLLQQEQELCEHKQFIENQNQTLASKMQAAVILRQELSEVKSELAAKIEQSVVEDFKGIVAKIRQAKGGVAEAAVQMLPARFRQKERETLTLFGRLYAVLKYPDKLQRRLRKRYKKRQAVTYSRPSGDGSEYNASLHQRLFASWGQKSGTHYRELSKPELLPEGVRLIAFYLPQFHPIPENDAWWGKGFTEWTNVSRGIPQFNGHYQPRLPGELGFYDLRLTSVQKRQFELAKAYGINGFCFHFYWFAGKTLLEMPIQQLLNDPASDMPFCINWANENWSRRWDGLDDDILIEQSHSAEDDLAFIAHIAQYLEDPRYIRVDGKPLLMVYRPALLPDAKATARRWRDWCAHNGIGEIFLVLSHSFEHLHPADCGFDAAVEFAPNSFPVTNIAKKQTLINPEFAGMVFDYNEAVDIASKYTAPPYPKFRGLCPGWDNESRKPGKGNVFINSSPPAYKKWLRQLLRFTLNNFEKDQQLIFVNAWNEWAEGAYLEPDRRYGYAYLQATSEARLSIAQEQQALLHGASLTRQHNTAVVLHLYYLELWPEIREYLANLDSNYDLYVSIPEQHRGEFGGLGDGFEQAHIFYFPNQGRDISPFLNILRMIEPLGYQYLLKFHSKKSVHRDDGDVWRTDMLNKLLGSPAIIASTKAAFDEDATTALVAPAGHVLSSEVYWGQNEDNVINLAHQLNIAFDLQPFLFVAGSMFWCRPSSLRPLHNLQLTSWDFDQEQGQVDGTLAHAIERLFGLLVKAQNNRILEMDADASVHYRPMANTQYTFAKAVGDA